MAGTHPSLWQRLRRTARHRWWDDADARRALPLEAARRIEARVTASERGHGGEIRVCVEAGLPLADAWHGTGTRARALALFGQLGVWDTARNNGVLVYLLLADRAIEIVADRGLNDHVSAADWQAIVAGMREPLRAGRFEEALAFAVDAVGGLLARHFAQDASQPKPNELPDRLDLR